MPKILEDEKIYHAVMQVVSERGYGGATTKQMADAADVSEVTLFRKYENKVQLVKRAIMSIVENTDFASAVEYTGDIHADLLKIAQAYHATAVKHGLFFFSIFSEFARHPELVDKMDEVLNIFHTMARLIARYQSEGILKTEPPLHALATLLGPLMYIETIRKAKLDFELPPLDLSNHVTCFLKGRLV